MFKNVDSFPDFPKIEDEIVKFWKKNRIFEKSIESRPENKRWTFLDGPPFITGLPHYGTLLASLPKDLFPRYWTMKGYRVRRVWGWDCHGLPAENKVEGKLRIKRKKDIEKKIGVGKFIDECKNYVSQVSSEWEWYVDHIGRWVDFKNAYKTMDSDYMETVMWVFKSMYDKGYIYKGLRVSLFCPHCSTPISNFEVAMDEDNYKEITETATTYKYELKDEKKTYILAWSTTPWNKIATPALAVNPKLKYVKVREEDEYYILAKSTVKNTIKKPYHKVAEFSGEKLLGLKFAPHYDYYKTEKGKKAFLIVGGDFVTADEGTGVVTIAAYGEDDLKLMKKENIQIVLHVNDEGHLTEDVPKWAGRYYLDVNELVDSDLASRGLIYKREKYTHTVPTCWRCHTRLYYAPQNAWYVDIQTLKKRLLETNKNINWVPHHFKHGRFQKSLIAAPDWCISRSRYWGSPVPVWECSCGERFVPGSISELEVSADVKVFDLHKPEIDKITIRCKKCHKKVHRVPEVLDSWIEAGSASFAERHYPFNKKEKLSDFFPPDFIVEYTGQIRAWFYVVHVIANALFEKEGFKNVLVNGVILGTDGRKMSKNYGNYPDPRMLLSKYGGDALRLYLLGSTVMMGGDILISEEEYRSQVKNLLLIIWNSYKFFVTYAILHKYTPPSKKNLQKKPEIEVMDSWIFSRFNAALKSVTGFFEKYDPISALSEVKIFTSDLSTWYIRRSRERFGSGEKEAFNTLYEIMCKFSQLLAPIVPFISEEMFKNLTSSQSVHLTFWPKAETSLIDPKLEDLMTLVRKICEMGHSQRKSLQIKVRQPLSKITISGKLNSFEESLKKEQIEELITAELNVKKIEWKRSEADLKIKLDTKITKELREEGEARELIRQIQSLRKKNDCGLNERIVIMASSWPKAFEAYIKNKTLAEKIVIGDSLKIIKKN